MDAEAFDEAEYFALDDALAVLDMVPSQSAEDARARGRYVLEKRVDVLVARAVSTVDAHIAVPCIEDLIRTKRFAARPKDAEDIRLLRALQESRR